MNVNKLNHPNPGIKCQVASCYYYSRGDNCTAERIEVAPRDASTSKDTDCETYIPQK